MKSLKLLIAVVALFATTSASALGLDWGLMAGVSKSNFSVKGDGDHLADKMGYSIGLSLKADLPLIDVGPEIIYTRNTMSVDKDGYLGSTGTIKASSIDVPVVAALNILGPLQIELGPTFSLYSEAKAEYGSTSTNLGRFKSEVGYVAGAKVTILGTLIVGARFYGQFEPMRVSMGGNKYDVRQHSYSISVGANF